MPNFPLEEYPNLLWKPTSDQEVAIDVLPSNKGYLVADVTGKGKTYSAICSFAILAKNNPDAHLLVLSTKSAVASWRADLSKATTFDFLELTIHSPEMDGIAVIGHPITVMTYSSITKYPNFLKRLLEEKYVILVADEFHRAADPDSGIGKIVRYLRQFVKYMWGLTATPLGNHLESLYNLIDILKPGYLGWNWPSFLRQFCNYRKKEVPGGKRVVEILGIKKPELLAAKLRKIMIRRDIDVPVEFHRVTVKLVPEEERRYLIAAAGEMGSGFTETLKEFAARLPDLQLVVNNAADCLKQYNEDYDRLATKETKLLELAREVLGRGEPLAVFTTSLWAQRRLLAVCEKNLTYTRLLQINGKSSEDERAEISESFGGADLLIMSPAGGESLNLQASGNLIFFDLPFDLRQFVQAAGRVVRMNTLHKKVHLWILEALETIDSYKSLMVFSNSQLFEAVMKGTKTLPAVYGRVSKDLLAQMRKRLLWRTKELMKRARG